MLSRTKRKNIRRSKRNIKLKSFCIKIINLLCKTYLYFGFAAVLIVSVASIAYKSYWHQEPPFNYQRYINDNKELVIVLTSVFTSFFISGVIAVYTETRNSTIVKNTKRIDKNDEHQVEKKSRSRRRYRKAS